MLKKSQKHKKRPEEVVELYKNNTFVSDSLSATCVSSVKFTADGQMSTKTIGKVGDRHLKAILKLPDLEERCAIPSNKNLYRLSIQLADNDSETHAADESSKELIELYFRESKGYRHQNNLARSRLMCIHKKDKLEQTYNITENSSVFPNLESKVDSEHAQNKNNKDYKTPKEKPVQSVQRKHKKIKKIRFENKKSLTSSSEESYYQTARTNQPQIRCKKRKEKQQVIQLANNLAKLQPQEKREQNILSEFEQSNSINSLLASNLNKSKELTQVFKATMRTIDDWYKFTFLLFLGTAAFLIYILYFDISIYLNEERRYLAKMRKAGIVLKCFFYVMRLLKVPIF
ncbi:hypothetical protein ACLKA7_012777 [Drosophila subpalustris]